VDEPHGASCYQPGLAFATSTGDNADMQTLRETLSFVTPTMKVPFVESGSALPMEQKITLSTNTDEQETLHVNLIQGETPLVTLEFPIRKRGPRGTVKIELTLRISSAGELSLSLIEAGTSNILDRGGLAVLIR
jgi:molecular chaperone DnaK (HSP70)